MKRGTKSFSFPTNSVNSIKLIIPRLRFCVLLCENFGQRFIFIWFDSLKQHSHGVKFSFNGSVYYYKEISYFARKNQSFGELQLDIILSRVPDSPQMSIAWYIFKTHARDFESYLKFLVNLENKICTIAKTRYYYFSNHLKNGKECGKSWASIFLPSTIYLQKMRYIP